MNPNNNNKDKGDILSQNKYSDNQFDIDGDINLFFKRINQLKMQNEHNQHPSLPENSCVRHD